MGDYLNIKKLASKHKSGSGKWAFGEGYHIGTKNEEIAPHITGQPLVETDKFQESGIVEISVEKETKFYRPKKKDDKLIFEPPHLLIKESPGGNRFITAYLEEYLVFKHEIIGIHAPWEQKEELKKIEVYLQENYLLLKTLLLSFSSRAGISRSFSTVLKKDFMNLPFPEDISKLKLTSNEEIIVQDILDYGLDELKRGENSLVNVSYVNAQQLQEFGEVFISNLNKLYELKGNSFHPLEPIDDLSYICFPFVYGTEDSVEIFTSQAKSNLNELIQNEKRSVTFQRVLSLYQQDIIYLVKPKILRYWLKSIALRDATQVMQDLIASGY